MELLELMGISLLVAAASGSTMGLYLAQVNRFIPAANVRKSLITNFVVAGSFFIPIAMQRTFTDDPTLSPVAWTALSILYLTFSTTADVTNYVLCHRSPK